MNELERQRELVEQMQSAKSEEEKEEIKKELLILRRKLRFTDFEGDCIINHK